MILYKSVTVSVDYSETPAQLEGYVIPVYVVRVAGQRARRFRGESAWEDAERYASDHDMAAWGCTR
jgi:hypothetical protein